MLLVFVYDSSAIPCTAEGDARSRFESRLAQLFETGWHRTSNPTEADIFFHPACLVDRFWRDRASLRQIDKRITQQILRLGFAHRPHIVNALRCYGLQRNGSRYKEDYTRHGMGTTSLPTLWAQPPAMAGEPEPDARLNRSFWRFCLEATKPVDRRRSASFPYCYAAPRLRRPIVSRARPPPTSRRRSTSVLFVGSLLPARRMAIAALNKTRGSRIVLLERRTFAPYLLDLMRDANYTLCPEGDTPESERIYQALERGSIPIVASKFQPVPVANWSDFSARIDFDEDAACTRRVLRSRHLPPADCVGPLRLPSLEEQSRLERGVRAHADDFRCDATRAENPVFATYVLRSLHAFVEESKRQERAGHFPRQRSLFVYPESAVQLH